MRVHKFKGSTNFKEHADQVHGIRKRLMRQFPNKIVDTKAKLVNILPYNQGEFELTIR